MKCVVCLNNQNNVLYALLLIFLMVHGKEMNKDEVDKVIEDEITHKLSEDLLQSIEKKFHVDLERSVDSVLLKIKLLLQNGTTHIQEKLSELQELMSIMKNNTEKEVDSCLEEYQNETTALAEKALHQMVVCGYALIGHDPAQAVRNVMELKTMIKHGLKPIYKQREEVYNLLKICGHDHDSLKKVIKCVISKSPQLKSAMMGVSGKLIDGVVHLTKQMAHGAMHEACLIEVIKTIEEEAFLVIGKVRQCTSKNETGIQAELEKYISEDNATVLDIQKKDKEPVKEVEEEKKEELIVTQTERLVDVKEGKEMKTLLRRMLKESKTQEGLDKKFKDNILKIQKGSGVDTNALGNDAKNAD